MSIFLEGICQETVSYKKMDLKLKSIIIPPSTGFGTKGIPSMTSKWLNAFIGSTFLHDSIWEGTFLHNEDLGLIPHLPSSVSRNWKLVKFSMWAPTSKRLNSLSFTSNQLLHLGTTDSNSYREVHWEVGIESQRLSSQTHRKIWECSRIQTDYLTTLEQLNLQF